MFISWWVILILIIIGIVYGNHAEKKLQNLEDRVEELEAKIEELENNTDRDASIYYN